jgi:hypothetical protein
MAARALDIDPINGGDSTVSMLAHEAIDRAFANRIASLWETLMRDAKAHNEHLTEQAEMRFNTGYRLAVRARAEAHKLIDHL